MAFVVFRCRNCGAGIPVQPDNLLTVCEHCGQIYPAQDIGDVPVYIIPSVSRDTIVKAVEERMANDPQMRNVKIHVEHAAGVYVPFYINRAHIEGPWKGYIQKKNSKDWRSGRINNRGDFPVLARNHAHEFGLQALGQVLFAKKPIPFRKIEWTSAAMPVLSVDLDEEQIEQVIRDDLVNRFGDQIRSRESLTAITEFDTQVEVENRFLLLYPLWRVLYRYKGGTYRVAVGGGGPDVLAAMEPTFFSRRLGGLALGLASTVGAGGLFFIGVMALPLIDSDEGGGLLLAIGAGILACFYFAWRTASRLIESVNIEYLED